jgi:hypothetical protein
MTNGPRSTEMPVIVGERYRLLRRIGRDESAETWEAFDTRLDRRVALRLLDHEARIDGAAQAQLREAARGRVLGAGPDAPRILDGGEDPRYGPFVVAELNAALEPTQRLSVVPEYVSPPVAERRPPSTQEVAVAAPIGQGIARERQQQRGAGLLALAGLAVVAVAAVVFVLRTLAPSPSEQPTVLDAPPAAAQPTRASAGAPAAEPTSRPTRASTAVPTAVPTALGVRPAAEPTRAPAAAGATGSRQSSTSSCNV